RGISLRVWDEADADRPMATRIDVDLRLRSFMLGDQLRRLGEIKTHSNAPLSRTPRGIVPAAPPARPGNRRGGPRTPTAGSGRRRETWSAGRRLVLPRARTDAPQPL